MTENFEVWIDKYLFDYRTAGSHNLLDAASEGRTGEHDVRWIEVPPGLVHGVFEALEVGMGLPTGLGINLIPDRVI